MLSRIAEAYRRTRKPRDLLWNRFVARPLAAVLLPLLERAPVTPNQVTFASLVVFAAAATVVAVLPGWRYLLVGVALLELSYVLDCVDGQLARLRGTSTPVGAHLDFLMDELKAFLLVAAVALRMWLTDGSDPVDARRDVWLIEGLLALVTVASAISLTTFMRRPEYANATGHAVKPGTGDYSDGASGPPRPQESPRGFSPVRLIEKLGSFIVHYPSYIVFVALADRMDLFLHTYFAVNAAYLGRSLLAIMLKLGRRAAPDGAR